MEIRQSLRGTAVPKALLTVLALCAAVLLAVGASYIGRGAGGSGSFGINVHPAPFTVLRQDYQGPVITPLLDRGAERPAGSTVIRRGSPDWTPPGFRD